MKRIAVAIVFVALACSACEQGPIATDDTTPTGQPVRSVSWYQLTTPDGHDVWCFDVRDGDNNLNAVECVPARMT